MNQPTPIHVGPQERTLSCADCGAQVTMIVTVLPSGRIFGLARDEFRCDACLTRAAREREVLQQEAEAEQRVAQREERRRRAIERLATPRLFQDARIASTEMIGSTAESNRRIDRAVFFASKVISGVAHGASCPPLLNFHGMPGSGKTRMLYAIANDLAHEHARAVRVVKLSQLIRDLRAPWRSKAGPDEQERLDAYIALDFLGIDEVSRHAFYGQSIEQHLWDVINGRLEEGRPTVITSNETPSDVEAILGAAIASRLRLGGHVAFPDEDFRPLQPREWLEE